MIQGSDDIPPTRATDGQLSEDQQDHLSVEETLLRLKHQRLQEHHQSVYIPPMAKANLQARDEDLFPLMEKVQDFLTSKRQVMLVLGDSGAGKSTFNRHLEHQLWINYNKGDPIPLYINLPAIREPEQNMVAKQLKILEFEKAQIQEMKPYRLFILICDGYDESQQVANLHATNFLNQPGQWRVKMIISCRSQYLGPVYLDRFAPQPLDHYQRTRLDLFQEAVIAPFSKKQIEDYVTRYVPLEPRTWVTEDYMRMLTTIPNLLELVKNPFLLTLALEALPGVTKGENDLSIIRVTRVQLYDHFVNQWLGVNMRRLQRNVLSREDRETLDCLLEAGFTPLGIDFSTRLATAIFEKQDGNPVVQYIHFNDKNSWKTEFFAPRPEIRLLRDSSPLTRTGSLYRFVHRSMLEYFFSRAIYDASPQEFAPPTDTSLSVDQSPESDGLLFRRNLLTEPSIIQFLAERVQENSTFKQFLLSAVERSKRDAEASTAASNAITILVKAGVLFNGADLRGIQIPGANLCTGQFDSVQFQGADLRGAKLIRAWIRQADFSDAKMDGIQFGELPYLEENSGVSACSYSPDGETFAVGLKNGGIRMYRTATWTITQRTQDQIGGVCCMGFSPDSQLIVSGSGDKKVRVWNASRGRLLLVMRGHAHTIISVAFSSCGRQIASASKDGQVRLWCSQTGLSTLVLDFAGVVTSVVFSPSGHQLVGGCEDGTIRFWHAKTGEPGDVWVSSRGATRYLAYSSDCQRIASGHDNGTVQLWSTTSGNPSLTLHGHTSAVTSVAFSPGDQWLASSSSDCTVRLCDASSGVLISVLAGHKREVSDISFSPDGLQIASGSQDKMVRLWEVNFGGSSLDLGGHIEAVSGDTYSPDDWSITSGRWDETVRRWCPPKEVPRPFHLGNIELPLSITSLSDGTHIATGTSDTIVELRNHQACSSGPFLEKRNNPFTNLTTSSCGRWVVSVSWGGDTCLWDLHDTESLPVLIGLSGEDVHAVAFSPTGRQFTTGNWNGTVRVFNLRIACNAMTIMKLESSGLSVLEYSPSGQQIAIGSTRASIYLWDLMSKYPDFELCGHALDITCISYSPCGEWIASGSEDKTVRLWHLQSSWSCVSVIRDFVDNVTHIAWNPFAPLEFVVESERQPIRIWRVLNDLEGTPRACLILGSNVGQLIASDVLFEKAIGLGPVNRQLLKQRSTVRESWSDYDDSGDDSGNDSGDEEGSI